MISDDVGSPGTIMAGIEVSPEALNEIKMTDEPMETTTAKWLSESEERAAQLFLQKIFHFSGPTGSTTTAQIGKSWPSASLQKGLVEQMKKWQEKRQYKFRSDLLFRWAKNLQEEEKLNISPNGKSTSRFLLRPCVGVLVEDVPESEFEGHFEGETEEADSSMEEKASTVCFAQFFHVHFKRPTSPKKNPIKKNIDLRKRESSLNLMPPRATNVHGGRKDQNILQKKE